MPFRILNEVTTQPLALDMQFAQSYGLMLSGLLKGEVPDEKNYAEQREKLKSFAIDASMGLRMGGSALQNAPAGSIAVIQLNGPVIKNSQFCGPRGTLDIAADFEAAFANPNITGIIFEMETGGGAALAVKPLADVLLNKNKPVIALTGDVIASAGYYLAVYCDEIMAQHPQSIVGSIGTMISFMDVKPALEKQGVKFHEVYATKSTKKNNTFKEALAGNYEPIVAKMLDPMNELFLADVKAQRGEKISQTEKDIYAGETYTATDALALGMIDSIGSFKEAVARIQTLAEEPPVNQNLTLEPNMKFPKLHALAKTPAAEINQEAVDAVNTEIAEAEIEGVSLCLESDLLTTAELQETISQRDAALVTANESIASITAERDALQARLVNAAVAPTAPVKVAEKVEGSASEPTYHKTSVDLEKERLAAQWNQ